MTLAANLSFLYSSTLTVAGNIVPPANNTYNVGTSTFRYNNMYVNNVDGAQMNIGVLAITTSLQTTFITSGSTSTNGNIAGQWSLIAGSKLQATYSDLAEYYEADSQYDVGTVLVFGGEKEVTQSGIYMDRRVAGVISAQAAYEMNSDCPGIAACIALQGRVPVKVIGQIAKGDILVSSDVPGHATVCNDPTSGSAIGKSLENKTTNEAGVVEAAVGRF